MMPLLKTWRATARIDGAGGTPSGRVVIWLALLLLAVFFLWAAFAEIDEVTRAPASVIPSSRVQVIESQDGGVLEALYVAEGGVVDAGLLLARVDRTRAEANYMESRVKFASLSAKAARLTAEVLGGEAQFPDVVDEFPDLRKLELALMDKRRAALQEQLAALTLVRDLAQEELDMNQPLLALGDVSKSELLRLQRQIAELRAEITNKRNAFFQEVQTELSEVSAELAIVAQQMRQRKNVLDQTELYAPMPGIVKDLKVTTIGGVIRPGDEVMRIVPIEDDLLLEGKINPSDIAFLEPGLDVRVKIDAYDYTLYGDLSGRLTFISADTLEEGLRDNEAPYYRIRVRTEGRRFSAVPDRDLEILPGMTAMVEIKTGRRSILQYLLKPLIKTLDESFSER